MTDVSGQTAETEEAPIAKKRGPKSKADLRAEIEAEIRAELETEVRASVESEIAAKEKEAEKVRAASAAVTPISSFDITGDPQADGAVTIHFVDDGLTILGKVWLRGEELTLVPGTQNWTDSLIGDKCFALMDEFEQETYWGRRFFRSGVWRGQRWDEIDDEELTDAERAQLQKAAALREERYGPVLNV